MILTTKTPKVIRVDKYVHLRITPGEGFAQELLRRVSSFTLVRKQYTNYNQYSKR